MSLMQCINSTFQNAINKIFFVMLNSKAGLPLGDFFVQRRLFRGRAIFNGRGSCLLVFTSGDSNLENRRLNFQ